MDCLILVCAIGSSKKKFSVIAVDLDKKIIKDLKNGKPNIYEKNLEKIIVKKNLKFFR